MNRLMNKYGVLTHKTPEGEAVDFALKRVRESIKDTSYVHNFSVEELISFQHFIESEVLGTFAEIIIKKGILLRAEERVNAKMSVDSTHEIS